MLLRSSSTPVLGSLLSKSISVESPNSNYWLCSQSEIPNPITRHHSSSPSSIQHNYNKISSKQLSASFSSEFPGKSPAAGGGGFRRAQSDGNLKGLDVIVGAPCDSIDELDLSNSSASDFNLVSRSRYSTTLEAIPSFSLYDSTSRCEEEEDDNTQVDEEDFGCSVIGGENIGFGEEMYLARGLGVSDGNFILRDCNGGGGSGDGDGDEVQSCHGIDGHYLRLLEENPCNSLYLRNYASYLYQKKRNLEIAENYYSRAILEDPKDGEVLSEYAHLIWDLYRDKDRATCYFERAIKTAAENSHVHASFARFLWETEDEDEDCRVTSAIIREGVVA